MFGDALPVSGLHIWGVGLLTFSSRTVLESHRTYSALCTRACMLSHSVVSNYFVTPQTVARQAPLSMGFSRQKYWSGLPCPPPGHLPQPRIKSMFPALAGGFLTTALSGKPYSGMIKQIIYCPHSSSLDSPLLFLPTPLHCSPSLINVAMKLPFIVLILFS